MHPLSNIISPQKQMFLKKPSSSKLPCIDPKSMRQEIIKRDLNHEFFLLVRDQKYEEAYSLGMACLEYSENTSIRKFCSFIESNRSELQKMVQEELEYSDDESSEESEDSEEQEDKKSVISKASSSSSKSSLAGSVSSKLSASSSKRSAGKQNSAKCVAHTWNHNCRNKDCPNRKKN